MINPLIDNQLLVLPSKPGVYIFRDLKDQVLYVGKAKVLKNRVRSYFQPGAILEPAKQQMVPKVVKIDTISCDTENEALILEANLIRQHKPPYNVVLTDDKYYLFIKVTKEPLPRVYPVRRITTDGARYFGPYSSALAVRRTLKLLRRLFPHFGESTAEKTWMFPHPLFADQTKLRVTLRGSPTLGATAPPRGGAGAAGPAAFEIDHTQYQANIHNVISFLEGKRDKIMARLQEGMRTAAHEKSYEQAALFRDQLHAIEKLEGSQKVYLPTKESFDVISVVTRQHHSAANVFNVRDGKLLQKNTFLLKHRSAALIEDVLRQFLLQYYRVAQDIPQVILIPHALPDQAAIAHWINDAAPPELIVPQRGKKRQLLTMGELNAQQLLTAEEIDFASTARLERATAELFRMIGIEPPAAKAPGGDSPVRIETYDISNIQGTLATGSMVVFIDGKPSKQHYKKFRIRLPETPNDFAMLQEVLGRRFSNRHPDWAMPDLVIIDGGKGQLSAAKKILDELKVSVPVIALAKREEEIFTCPARSLAPPGGARRSGVPLQYQKIRLPYDSDALYLIQRMRDEAHRFTITYHRLLRSKRASRSILDDIPGVGPKVKKRLLSHLGSVKGIREATDEALIKLVGPAKTKTIREYL